MSTEKKSSGVPAPIKIIVGLAIMVAGVWLHKNWHPAFIQQLADSGVPIDPGMTVATIGVLIALFPVINSFYIAPLMESINSRNAELESTFAEAQDLRTEMAQMKSEYERRLAETEASAREQIQAQIKEAQNLRQSLMAEATSKADEMVKRAQKEIEEEKHRVLTDLRLHVVDLTLGATEKLLGENMDTDKNRRLIDEFVASMEVAR